MKLGIQLYSLSREMDKDFDKTIEAVAKMGYDGVEFAGYYGRTAKEVKKAAADNGLEICSAHIGLANEKDWKGVLDFTAEAGIPAAIIPYMSPEAWFPRCNFERTIDKINRYCELAKTYGIRIGFHNHYMEFSEVFGKTIMQQIYENTPADFIMQIDCCWAQYGTDNAAAVIEKYSDKTTTLCHYKQLLQLNDSATTTIDKGCIDFKEITKFLKAHDAKWAIVEQEEIDIPDLEAAKINHDYVRSIL